MTKQVSKISFVKNQIKPKESNMRKKSKFLFRSMAVALLIGGSSVLALQAEPVETPPDSQPPVNLMAAVAEKLELTDEQKAKTEPIFQASLTQRRALLEKYRGQTDFRALRSFRTELESIDNAEDAQLKGILTDEQMKKLHELRTEIKKRIRQRLQEQRNNPQ
jgi:Spy/CpxP family protein refolding chaperone